MTTCSVCGHRVDRHFDARRRFIGCAGAASRLDPVDRSTLVMLKVACLDAARQRADDTIRRTTRMRWTARIGGAFGFDIVGTEREVRRAVCDYYDNRRAGIASAQYRSGSRGH